MIYNNSEDINEMKEMYGNHFGIKKTNPFKASNFPDE